MKQLKIRHVVKRSYVFVGTLLVAANAWTATWYENGTSGGNGNSGLEASSAKKTLQATIDADNLVPTEGWPSWVLGTWTGAVVNVVYEHDGSSEVYKGNYELTLTSIGSHEKYIFDDGETDESDSDNKGWKIIESRDCHVIATCWCWNDEEDDEFDATYVFRDTICTCNDGKSSFRMQLRDGDDTVEGTLTKVDVTDPENPTVRATAAVVNVGYDGEGHGISVSVTTPASGATVEYARAKDGPWQADAILFTNVCTATKVWYRALADGYAGVTNAATVTVNPRQISNATLTLLGIPEAGYKYDGTAKTPTVSVTDTLASFSSSDYTIAYAANVNAGTAKVTVTGVGNYGGTVEATFAIAPRELTFTSADAEWAWDGAAHSRETAPVISGNGFVGADGVTFSDFASVTAPGSYENTFAYAFTAGTVASNYAVTQVYGTLLVHNYRATVKADGTMRIDGLGGEALGSTELVIPETIDGIPVTEIKEDAFGNSTCGMTTLKLAKYCKMIGESAFHGVKTLQRVAFVKVYETDGVTEAKLEIGDWAFSGCSGLTSVTIPDSVTNIGDYAFSGCDGLADSEGFVIIKGVLCDYVGDNTSVTIPAGVASIGGGVFFYRKGLTSVMIPDGVTSIGDDAFRGCSGLRSIRLPNSVTSIGDSAFKCCDGLADLEGFVVIRGVLYDYVGDDTSATIPAGVTNISGSVFFECSGLTSVTMPDSVTSIGNFAFCGCSGLTSMTIPDGVASIGSYAFYGCSSLTSLTLPAGVTNIGDEAFDGCSSLARVALNSGAVVKSTTLKDLFPSAYAQLTHVALGEDVTEIPDGFFGGCVALTDFSFSAAVAEVTIPDGVDVATVRVSPDVKSVAPNGAKVRIVRDAADITDYLDIPAAVNGVIDLGAATVKAKYANEALDTANGAEVRLTAEDPVLKTVKTRPGLVYRLYEGASLGELKAGASTVGDGAPWMPKVTVKGGASGFYLIRVSK